MPEQSPLRRIALDGAWIAWYPDSSAVHFWDGTTLVSAPQETEDYAALAKATGYTGPRATWQMAVEHDLWHLWLAQMLHAPDIARTVPWCLAHQIVLPQWVMDGQEALTIAFARYVNTGYAGHELAALHLAGVDLARVREQAHSLRTGDYSAVH